MKLGQFFTRENDRKVVTLTDDRPQWLYDAVYEAHRGDLPNDWIFEECQAACDAIDDERLSDEDSVHEHADSRVDIYTKDLYQWQADMCLTSTFSYAEEEATDCDETRTGSERVMGIQYFAIRSIAETIRAAWEASKEESEDSDD